MCEEIDARTRLHLRYDVSCGETIRLGRTSSVFQSDARQIDEQRPPWIARAVLYVLVALIACAIGWASIAKIDRIVVAQGKLITTARLLCSHLRPL
jgi:hypothetical protein